MKKYYLKWDKLGIELESFTRKNFMEQIFLFNPQKSLEVHLLSDTETHVNFCGLNKEICSIKFFLVKISSSIPNLLQK